FHVTGVQTCALPISFFDVDLGADPLLWQNLFWLFGHPEVYILILPAFGIVSEIVPVFARKPLFGYPLVVLSGAAIGFVGWGVWEIGRASCRERVWVS